MNSEVRASSHYLAQRPVAAADACCCRTTDLTRPVTHRAASSHLYWARFFAILCPVWFPSSCLDFVWYLGSSLMLLGSCLWCWSWDHHVAFVQVTSCTLLNYKTITYKFISLIWLCWSSNTKIQSKWAYGPFSLQYPHLVIDDNTTKTSK